jgi:cyclopropane fatty-acyl-phospholipid synthase-like methyltransferase
MLMRSETINCMPEVIRYYNSCWLERFEKGHNPISRAMHLGHFVHPQMDNDEAKLHANRFLAESVQIPEHTEVAIADLGCGVGGTCFYLAKTYAKATVHGVNISPDQVAFANRLRELNGLDDRVRFFVSDYSSSLLDTGSYDYVFGVESICHAIDKGKVYEEAFRLLRPGGVFAMMDYTEEREPYSDEEKGLLEDFRIGWAIETYIQDHLSALSSVGFREVSESSILKNVIPGIDHSYQKALRNLSLDQDEDSDVRNHLKACIALKPLSEAGLIDYKLIIARK